jgi:hypothetical protein
MMKTFLRDGILEVVSCINSPLNRTICGKLFVGTLKLWIYSERNVHFETSLQINSHQKVQNQNCLNHFVLNQLFLSGN